MIAEIIYTSSEKMLLANAEKILEIGNMGH